MKKLTKKSRMRIFIVADILISIVVSAAIFAGVLCFIDNVHNGYKKNNRKPDDKLSRLVRETVGDDLYYRGKHEDVFGGVWYKYLIKKKDKAAVVNLVNVLNNAVEGEQRKIGVQVGAEFSSGIEYIFTLENFSDDGLETADYDGMHAVCIQEPDHVSDECFYDPSIYTGIEGVRKLCIDSEMQQKAEKKGIDWHEIWPDLEVMLIDYGNHFQDDEIVSALQEAVGNDFDYGGKVENRASGLLRYEYYMINQSEYQMTDRDKDVIANFVKILNDALEDEQRKIQVEAEGSNLHFSVENFSDVELEEADFDGMYAIHIFDPESIPGYAEEACIPSLYTKIQGIRKLYIGPKMKKQAEKEGIDWYELWPDLEEVEVTAR